MKQPWTGNVASAIRCSPESGFCSCLTSVSDFGWLLAAREHGSKVCLGQDACDFRAFVALNLDLAVLHRSAGAAGALHRFGQLLLFRQSDADKAFHHRHRLAAASGRLSDDVHAPAVLRCRFGCIGWGEAADEPAPPGIVAPGPARGDARPTGIFGCGREPGGGQGGKGVVAQTLSTIGGNAFVSAHACWAERLEYFQLCRTSMFSISAFYVCPSDFHCRRP